MKSLFFGRRVVLLSEIWFSLLGDQLPSYFITVLNHSHLTLQTVKADRTFKPRGCGWGDGSVWRTIVASRTLSRGLRLTIKLAIVATRTGQAIRQGGSTCREQVHTFSLWNLHQLGRTCKQGGSVQAGWVYEVFRAFKTFLTHTYCRSFEQVGFLPLQYTFPLRNSLMHRHVCMHTYMHTCMRTHTHMRAHAHTHTHTHTHTISLTSPWHFPYPTYASIPLLKEKQLFLHTHTHTYTPPHSFNLSAPHPPPYPICRPVLFLMVPAGHGIIAVVPWGQ